MTFHSNTKLYFLLFSALMMSYSCQESIDPAVEELRTLMDTAKNDPNKDNFAAYFTATNDFLQINKDNKAFVKPILEQAAAFAVSHDQHGKAAGYFMPLVKDYANNCKSNPETILSLANSMRSLNKTHAATVMYANYKKTYPDAKIDTALDELMNDIHDDPTVFIDTLFEKVFLDPDQYGLNRNAALKYVDVVEAFALSAPCSEKTPDYLYRAGEIARSIRTLPKAMSIYDWILESYPDHEKTPTVYFLKGFMMENNVKDEAAAKTIYEDFLVKYPNHEMADDVQFLLDHLGKSDEEILEFLEQPKK